MNNTTGNLKKWVSRWLLIGVIMVFVQILLGGITRLTGSGLSITKWDIVTGTIPPLHAHQWTEAFAHYQQTPQYKQINAGMSLEQFKFIFFWEYLHRLWARSMGFIFLMPFLFFLWKRQLDRVLMRRLLGVIGIASTAALFGWIMVASGLVSRPWVNAYKLTIHLSLGIGLFLYLGYTWIRHRGYQRLRVSARWRPFIHILLVLILLQVILGGLVSGMKAALSYPTWPLMHGQWLPAILLEPGHWNQQTFLMYDQSLFMPALVQFFHRNTGYLIFILVLIFFIRWIRIESPGHHRIAYGMLGIIVVQVSLGILTLIGSIGAIPVYTGVFHQAFGILSLAYLVFLRLYFEFTPK